STQLLHLGRGGRKCCRGGPSLSGRFPWARAARSRFLRVGRRGPGGTRAAPGGTRAAPGGTRAALGHWGNPAIREIDMAGTIAWFGDISREDVSSVGGKGANLGEMTGAGLPVPPGFVVTASAFLQFLESAGIRERLRELFE